MMRIYRTCVFTVCLSAAQLALAAPVKFDPYVLLDGTYDSNLFRLSEIAKQTLASDKYSDEYYQAAVGGNLNWQHKRQVFNVGGEINANKFSQNDSLDYNGGFLKAKWDWVGGRLWNGQVIYNFNRNLKNFSNSLIPRRDIKSTHRLALVVDRKLNERWYTRLGAEYREVAFSTTNRSQKEEVTLDGGFFYKSHAENITGINLKVLNASFPNRDANVVLGVDDGFSRTSIEGVTHWKFSGTSKVNAWLGYTSQVQNNVSSEDFDGFTGRFLHTWDVSGKTSLKTSAWRKLSTLGDEIANYAIVTGIGIDANWGVTNKAWVQMGVAYENRDFKGGEDLVDVASFELREDDVLTYRAGVYYTPHKSSTLGLTYTNGNRNSNRDLREYDYYSVNGSIKVIF